MFENFFTIETLVEISASFGIAITLSIVVWMLVRCSMYKGYVFGIGLLLLLLQISHYIHHVSLDLDTISMCKAGYFIFNDIALLTVAFANALNTKNKEVEYE